MKLVYLAGPISITTYAGATAWRNLVARDLGVAGIGTLDPMRGKAYLKDIAGKGVLQDAYDKVVDSYGGPEHPLSTGKGVTRRDHWDVRSCDAVLFYMQDATKPSIGCMIELGWASAYRKYTIVVMSEGNPHWHGMVRDLADLIVPTLEEATTILVGLLGGQS